MVRFLSGCILVLGGFSAQAQHTGTDPATPFELKFADVTFQLSDVTRYLLSQELAYFQKNPGIRNEYLSKMALYLPVITPLMRSAGVPEDFRLLSIYTRYQKGPGIVSDLEPGVFWCFEPSKAAAAGLRVNGDLDERKHLSLSTAGAMNVLKENYALYNSWAAALFAQIADRRILEALDVPKRWNNNRFVVLDSPAYSSLIHFLAFRLMLEREWPGFRPEQHLIVYEYPYAQGKSLNLIAADLQVEPDLLVQHNLWLKVNKVPEEAIPVTVVVPSSRYHEIRKLASLSRNLGISGFESGFPVLKDGEAPRNRRGGRFYLINGKKGILADFCDSHVTLAYKAGLTLDRFLAYNEMTERDVTVSGQIYYLQEKEKKGPIPFHIVKEGETAWYISQMYGIKLKALMAFNRMESVQRLQNGRIMWLQKKRSSRKPVEFVEIPEEKPYIRDIDSLLSVPEVAKAEEKIQPVAEQTEMIPEGLTKPSEVNAPKTAKSEVPNEKRPEEITKQTVVQETVKVASPPETKPGMAEPKTVIKNTGEVKPDWIKKLSELYGEGTEVKDGFVYHVVKKDETLYRISVNYKVSVETLKQLNNLKSNIIEIGDWIKVRPIKDSNK